MSEQWYEVEKALEAIAVFFERIGTPTSGDYFREISALIQQNRLEEATTELTGLTLWGGSGSYIDRTLYPENGYKFDRNDSEKVNKEYMMLLLQLADALKRMGMSSYWLDRAYEILRKQADGS